MAKKWVDSGEEWFIGIPQEFSWYAGAPFEGMTLNRTEGGWLLVIRTRSVQRGRLVAFFGGRTPADCYGGLRAAMETKTGINWKKDKYN